MSNHSTKPPRWANVLLRWFCAPHLVEEIEGDLQEEFEYQHRTNGLFAARVDYVRSVFGFMKPFAIKRKPKQSSTLPMNLFSHYLTTAFRQVWRHKIFSAINVAGLTLGLTSCMLIYLWIADEKAIDNFHANGNRLYNVYLRTESPTGVTGQFNVPRAYYDSAAHMLIEGAKEEIPEVEGIAFYHAGYTMPWGRAEIFRVGDKTHKLEGYRANNDFLTIFSYPIIAGDKQTPLTQTGSVAISRKVSDLFFTTPGEAVGKTMRYENKMDFLVTAVYEDFGPNNTIKADFIVNWEDAMKNRLDWASNNVSGTVLLAEGANVEKVTASLNKLAAVRMQQVNGATTTFGLSPYRDQYLVSNFVDGRPSGGRIEYIRIFTGVAIFILVIACINFMNLATARSIKRAKEVGVRKVIGSSRSFLVWQFFGESLMLAFSAMIASLIIVQLSLPFFNDITGKRIVIPYNDFSMWLKLIGMTSLTGIVAGSYPALFLSSLKPVSVLKGMMSFTRASILTRKGMAVFQFGLSILLLIATIVMSEQTNFMRNLNVGYDKENLLYFTMEGKLTTYDKYMAFKNAALQMPGLKMIDRSSEAPHKMGFLVDEDDGIPETNKVDDSAIKWEGKEAGKKVGFKPTSVGFDFISLMDLEVVEGRGFDHKFATDSADAFMVNEQAIKEMGITDPIGKWVSAWDKKGHIVGVLKDYNINSLHERIRPLIIDVKEYEYFGVVMVRTEAGKVDQAIASLEKLYKEHNPGYPFAFRFVEEDAENMYRAELVMAKLSNIFAGLAIAISCLGLLGLTMFSAEQRTREIGIRKSMGATVSSIVGLLSKDFLRIVILSFIIATPTAAYLMQQWLDSFAYKIPLSWWIFALAGMGALIVAFATISFQAVKSARANPVNALRSE